ncbi:hypothetical protein [Ferrimonas lipolytica]|uniref:Uncharacterized protein n=1 Tax=Ferrimonas lipolytica TaxID=2724191 RepID=A0A6H1UIC1_9GAMM|nr:hypothetical protein [Ferrimonas lipolytica]QIZ78063.1 hypothetical protein HER31_14855 [Ferrimonas lipolytica]
MTDADEMAFWHKVIRKHFGKSPISIPTDFTIRFAEKIQESTAVIVTAAESSTDPKWLVGTQISDYERKEFMYRDCKIWYQANRKNTGLQFVDKNSNSKFSRILTRMANTYRHHIEHLTEIYELDD